MEDRISIVLVTKESKKGSSLDYKSVVPFTEKQYDDFFEQLIQKNFYFACQFCDVIELDHNEENYYAILSSETLSFESKKKDELAKLEILASEFLRENRLVGYNEQTKEWFE